MTTYHLDLGDTQTEELANVLNLTLGDEEADLDEFVASDTGSSQARPGDLVLMRGDNHHPAATAWINDVEDTNTHQDVVIIAGDPTSPHARRIHLTNAWATWTFDRDDDNDDEADAIGIAFDNITLK
ncbi:hypothetical protein ACF07T_39630 [Streptomyces sp. NPDC015184]|uniref:hypothetical protein n=1 Tax=Streptomyces sp. NPDC015184 TaxID=3364946 RepID=UPI0036FB728E